MELGMVGLGKMGGNMAHRLVLGGHRVVGNARKKETVDGSVKEDGIVPAYSLEELVSKLSSSPKIIWLMIPSGDAVDEGIRTLLPLLQKDDILIDGGNSYYKDTLRRAPLVESKGVHYVDVGTSGGVWGLKEGYSMMVGGDRAIVEHIRPILETLAPGKDQGWGRMGPVGSGHFVKMVHNGIEYGLMEAYAEGFSVLKHKTDFGLDVHQIAEVWRYGSVVRSWLLDLTAAALADNPDLKGIEPYVVDSGEGRWTVNEGVDLGVPTPVIAISLLERIKSRETKSYADQLLAVMRHSFGGHEVKTGD
jgi:6-phosphogluconate dehydrogenase